MPTTILLGGKGAKVKFEEFVSDNGSGTPLASIGQITYASDNPKVATVDPNTGQVTAISTGKANIVGSDATFKIRASDELIVAGPSDVPKSAALILTAE